MTPITPTNMTPNPNPSHLEALTLTLDPTLTQNSPKKSALNFQTPIQVTVQQTQYFISTIKNIDLLIMTITGMDRYGRMPEVGPYYRQYKGFYEEGQLVDLCFIMDDDWVEKVECLRKGKNVIIRDVDQF
jgi:hypothetical protein